MKGIFLILGLLTCLGLTSCDWLKNPVTVQSQPNTDDTKPTIAPDPPYLVMAFASRRSALTSMPTLHLNSVSDPNIKVWVIDESHLAIQNLSRLGDTADFALDFGGSYQVPQIEVSFDSGCLDVNKKILIMMPTSEQGHSGCFEGHGREQTSYSIQGLNDDIIIYF